jgi:hypothetical protein
VGENTWLKRWAEGRKCEDDMKVDQELDLDGRAENGRNLGRAIPQTHLLFLKNQPVEVSGYSGSTYNHSFDLEALDRLSDAGSREPE